MSQYIQANELEQIARRVWYAKRDKASRVNGGEEKHASFEAMGFQTMSTEFPMRSGEWVIVGALEMSFSHGKWDIPGMIRVRKANTQEAAAL